MFFSTQSGIVGVGSQLPLAFLNAFHTAHQLEELSARIERLSEVLEGVAARNAAKSAIEPKARYHLKEAAEHLKTSTSTLKRRARANKLVIMYDGKTPFVMGAELQRYARAGAARQGKRQVSDRKGTGGRR